MSRCEDVARKQVQDSTTTERIPTDILSSTRVYNIMIQVRWLRCELKSQDISISWEIPLICIGCD
jgi:hypothetical protein